MSIPIFIYKTLRVNKNPNALRKIKLDLLLKYRQERNDIINGPIVRNNTWVLVTDYHMSSSDSDKHWTVRLVDSSKIAQGTVHVYSTNKEAKFYPTGPKTKKYDFPTFAKPFPV